MDVILYIFCMVYELQITQKAKKQMEKLPTKDRKAIADSLTGLCEDPSSAQNVKVLRGEYEGLYRIRVRSYRVFFHIRDQELIILIVKIAHRQSAY